MCYKNKKCKSGRELVYFSYYSDRTATQTVHWYIEDSSRRVIKIKTLAFVKFKSLH
jgi:hypothetical protein